MGKLEQKLARQAIKAGQGLPHRIANAPRLKSNLILYLDAFFDLSTDRPIGFAGMGPIPWGSINAYAQTYEFSEDQRESLIFFMKQMDAAYLAYVDSKKPKGKNGS